MADGAGAAAGRLNGVNRKQRRAAGAGTPADVPYLAGLKAHKAGQLARAETFYGRALAIDPQHAGSLNMLGVLLTGAGAHAAARATLAHAAEVAPENASVHYNLAGAHRVLGDTLEAMVHYQRAAELQPGHQGAWNNLGLVLQELGHGPEAAAAFRAALDLGADARIHVNLAALRREEGEPGRAAFHYRQALALDPRHVEARVGLADVLLASGDAPGALAEACRAVSAADVPAARAVFAAAVAAGAEVRGEAVELLRRALDEGWVRSRDLARPAARWVWERLGSASAVDGLAADPLLAALLRAAPVPHRELEAALTRARAALLDAAEEGGDDDRLPFWCALAEQCFLNEHVFDVTEEETRRVESLAARLAAEVAAGGPVAPVVPVAVASYVRLDVPGLMDRAWPAPVRGMLTRVVEEPRVERELAAGIAQLTPVDGDVSGAVRAQYEENPYPRWTGTLPPSEPVPLAAYLARSLPNPAPPPSGREVLIAGCGTGQQSLEVAAALSDAQVLAVDLSRASLAYARRRSGGLAHLRYAQADLLRLSETGREFDVIQASGVLHHLADPAEGWRALLAVLRPGGVMFLGLYSELARRDVVAARATIPEHGFTPTPAGIRACRRLMRDAPEGTPLRRLTAVSDFASLSGCRDLLFHVQEHRLTLPWIAAFVDAHGLEFLGFDLPARVRSVYSARFPGDPGMIDLRQWDAFEHDAPGTFARMYQFWVCKPGG